MATVPPTNSSHPRVRGGTALRRRGKDRVQSILQAARSILLAEGFHALSLRNVASRAGISLGNLSYYFGSKDDLFQSLLDDVLQEYKTRWEEILAGNPGDPQARFMAILDYHLEDCRNPETQQFFYQFWAISIHDEAVAECRRLAYKPFYDQMHALCEEVNPGLDADVRSRRVYLLMALIEGLHVIFGNQKRQPKNLAAIDAEFRRQALQIATSP